MSADQFNVTVLGLGAMGSRMAGKLLAAGHRVTVWNRTPGAADALLAAGARWAADPRLAVAKADFVIAMVRDDEASRTVWCDPAHGALAGMKPGAVAIDSSTLSPDWVRELGQAAQAHGVKMLEAPVSGSRPQAESGQLVYLVGGDSATVEQANSLLHALGSTVRHVGPLGSGALAKLATNALLGIQVTALAEIVVLLNRQEVETAKILQAVSSTSVWAPVANYLAGTLLAEDFSPLFPIELIAKDFGYIVAAAGSAEKAPTLAAARELFRMGVAQGLAQQNMTGVLRLLQ